MHAKYNSSIPWPFRKGSTSITSKFKIQLDGTRAWQYFILKTLKLLLWSLLLPGAEMLSTASLGLSLGG